MTESLSANASSRDGWTTPAWLCDLLPEVDLDPASNPRSRIRARQTYSLERGEDGLAMPWAGLVWINPPFSDVMPWVVKAEEQRVSCCFLVNIDPSASWFKRLQETRRLALFFHKRIQFVPPPGVTASTNSKAQALLMDEYFWQQCDARLSDHGTIWRRA